MTMINVDTSPLQAAREWRGINLVAAALASGLPVAQAEALEGGDPEAFATIDEMIASAVVYGASLGIGRDEAMALLDRTVSGSGLQVDLPTAVERPVAGFSAAVRERSARIAPPATFVQVEPLAPAAAMFVTDEELQAVIEPHTTGADAIEDVASAVGAAPGMPASLDTALPTVPERSSSIEFAGAQAFAGPSPEQAIAASAEIHVGPAFETAPWDRSGGDYTGELEAWAAEADDELLPTARVRSGRGAALATRLGSIGYGATERVLGSERADTVANAVQRFFDRIAELARAGREQMRRSEHATLIVAIGGGAVLIAMVVAIGGALGGGDAVNPATVRSSGPKLESPAADASGAPATTKGATTKHVAAAKVTPMLAPAQVHVDVFNAGSKKGYAKQVGAQLAAAHYQVGKVENAGGKYVGATVIYPKALAREAKVLATKVGISTLQVSPVGGTTITLVVT